MTGRWHGGLAAATAVAALLVLPGCSGGGSPSSSGAITSAAVDADAAVDSDGALESYGYTTFDDEAATLARFAGRPLVLNFFASWCVPCRAEMPDLEQVHLATRDDVAFLGLAVRDDADAARAMVAETGVTYPTGLDSEELLVDFDGFGMPTTVLFSPGGDIVDSHVGELSGDELRDKLAEHFGVAP